jgi:uncharacterized protein (DUF1697 family)
MPELRKALTAAGFEDARTYLQSGNVVLTSDQAPAKLAAKCEKLIKQAFDLDIDVVARTRDELAEAIRRNPFAKVADNPKRYQVSFLSAEIDPKLVDELAALATGDERFTAIGRELYAWHPAGVARSKLWARLAGRHLGVKATARNWTTVLNLLEMADEAE